MNAAPFGYRIARWMPGPLWRRWLGWALERYTAPAAPYDRRDFPRRSMPPLDPYRRAVWRIRRRRGQCWSDAMADALAAQVARGEVTLTELDRDVDAMIVRPDPTRRVPQ